MNYDVAKEVLSKMDNEKKENLYMVVGKTSVTGKKQSVSKALYTSLSAEEKKIFKFFIDRALI